MAGTTARLALPYSTLTDAADIVVAVKPLADALDAIALAYAKGTLAARPAAAAANGRVYYATDVGIMAFSDGATWQRLDLDALEAVPDARLGAPGDLIWSAAAIRAGSLLCDGTSYLRTAWPNLFTALGGAASPWGLPDGTHFKVPDMRGRTPIGAGTGAGLTARALAATGGEESHLLTEVESGLRTHGHDSGGPFNTGPENVDHVHATPTYTAQQIYNLAIGPNTIIVPITQVYFNTNGANTTHWHGATDPVTPAVAGAPAAAPHTNMQPWAAVNCFVKT